MRAVSLPLLPPPQGRTTHRKQRYNINASVYLKESRLRDKSTLHVQPTESGAKRRRTLSIKGKVHPFWMLHCFLCISEWFSIDSLGHFMFSCVWELLAFKQAEIRLVWRSTVIKSLSLHWKLIGIQRLDRENVYHTCQISILVDVITREHVFSWMSHWSYSYLEKCVI